LFEPKRFLKESRDAFDGLSFERIGFAAHEDDGQILTARADCSNGGSAVHDWHREVCQDQAHFEFVRIEQSEAFGAVGPTEDTIAMLDQSGHNHFADGAIVVDEDNQVAGTAG
jgi:hypothetical protein